MAKLEPHPDRHPADPIACPIAEGVRGRTGRALDETRALTREPAGRAHRL